MKNLDAMLGVGKDLSWETPEDLFMFWNDIFEFQWDLAASEENHKLPNYWDEEDDALSLVWDGMKGWLNPPYGRGIGKWVEKARVSAHEGGALICCLLPVRSDARWWQEHVIPADLIYFIPGRIKFVGAENNAPFGSAIVVYLPYGGNHRV